MKKLLFVICISMMAISCDNDEKDEAETPKQNNEMQATYEANLAILKSGIAAFEKKDVEGWAATIADTAWFNSPMYGDTIHTKAHWKESIKYYTDNWDDLKLSNSFFFPGVDSATHQMNGSVRYYGRWDGLHTASGVATQVKFYGTYRFNADHKVIRGNDFFDLGGLMKAVEKK